MSAGTTKHDDISTTGYFNGKAAIYYVNVQYKDANMCSNNEFYDASNIAYDAVAYVSSYDWNGIYNIRLLIKKIRVTRFKPLTIRICNKYNRKSEKDSRA